MEEDLQLCYTPKSHLAPRLLDNCEQYKLDNPFRSVTYLGDFNVHNPDWIHSIGDKDAGGIQAEQMCEMFGMKQLIDFPTRGENTLDLVMSTHSGTAVDLPGAGTSDHIAINIVLDLQKMIPEPPANIPTLQWLHAPWSHMKGVIKRELVDWDAYTSSSVDEPESDLDLKLSSIIDKLVCLELRCMVVSNSICR